MEDEEQNELHLINKGLESMPIIEESLRKLDIRRNKLKVLALPRNSQLEYLDVSDNLIETLDNLSDLQKLRFLDFGYNLVKEVPKLNLPALNELYLISNDIKEMENLEFLDLKKIDLANNEILVLKKFNCPNVQEAYFGANRINKIENLSDLKFLKILDLQCNDLTELDCSLLPESLETLLLNNNGKLKSIKNLEKLSRLKLLGVKNTLVADLELKSNVEIW